MPLNALPPELLVAIFELTRDDDGRLPPALCLLSQDLHAAALPLLYRVLVITRSSSVLQLARTLAARPSLTTHARHLFLADAAELEQMPAFAFARPASQEGRSECLRRLRHGFAARRVVAALAPHLRSATVLRFKDTQPFAADGDAPPPRPPLLPLRLPRLIDVTPPPPALLAHPFPRLVELTVRGAGVLPAIPAMPALARVHLAVLDASAACAALGALVAHCPHLTHARLTEPVAAGALAPALAALYADARGSTAGPQRTLQALAVLLVQLSPPPPGQAGCTALHDTVARVARGAAALRLVPPAAPGVPYGFDAARQDWASRLRGGAGCWAA